MWIHKKFAIIDADRFITRVYSEILYPPVRNNSQATPRQSVKSVGDDFCANHLSYNPDVAIT